MLGQPAPEKSMQIRIRHDDPRDDLTAYRRAQAEAFLRRNASRLRREFWERKQAAGE